MLKRKPKGTNRNQKEPKKNQKEPKRTKKNQKEPKGTKRNQKKPNRTKKNQKGTKRTKPNQIISAPFSYTDAVKFYRSVRSETQLETEIQELIYYHRKCGST